MKGGHESTHNGGKCPEGVNIPHSPASLPLAMAASSRVAGHATTRPEMVGNGCRTDEPTTPFYTRRRRCCDLLLAASPYFSCLLHRLGAPNRRIHVRDLCAIRLHTTVDMCNKLSCRRDRAMLRDNWTHSVSPDWTD